MLSKLSGRAKSAEEGAENRASNNNEQLNPWEVESECHLSQQVLLKAYRVSHDTADEYSK